MHQSSADGLCPRPRWAIALLTSLLSFPLPKPAWAFVVWISFAPFVSGQTITLGFDGLSESSLKLGDFGVTFEGAAVLTCGGSLNCGEFPPYSGANVIFDEIDSNGIISAHFDTEITGNVTLVSARITGNTRVTLVAIDTNGNVVAQDSTSGPNFVGSGSDPNELVEVQIESGSISRVVFRDSGNTFTVDDFRFDGLTQRRIVVDAGHGRKPDGTFDRDPVPPTNIIEDLLTLDISRSVQEELERDPRFLVKQTRTGESTVPIDRRRQIAEVYEAEAFVSIHTNGASDASVNGAETLVNETRSVVEKSRKLAANIQTEMVSSLDLRNRGVKESPDLAKILQLGVLKSSTVPSTLAEIGFHTNTVLDFLNGQTETDNEKLARSSYKRSAGRAVARGIAAYFDALEAEAN